MNKSITPFIVPLFFLNILGCDRFASFVDHFSSKKKQTTPPIAQNLSSNKAVEATSSPAPAPLPANVLAKVGNWTITKEEFGVRLKNLKEVVPDFNTGDIASRKLVLEELVRQQLLVMDAEQNGLTNKKEIADAVEEFRRTLLVREIVMKLTKDIKVTEQEAEAFYNENKKDFTEPVQWHAREIVVETKDEASQILIELLKGADFAQMAQTRSKSKTASQGGDLGSISEASFPQMKDALLALEVGGVSSVFKGPDGYYVVKLEEKKGGQQKEFSAIKEDIIEGLTLMKQQQTILDYLNQLQQKISVKINEDLLKD